MKQVSPFALVLMSTLLISQIFTPTESQAQLRVKKTGEVEVGAYPTNTGTALFVSSTDRAAFYAFGRYSFPYGPH